MSIYLRLVVGPVVVVDAELFGTKQPSRSDDEAPPQLNGGAGMVVEPFPFGFETT